MMMEWMLLDCSLDSLHPVFVSYSENFITNVLCDSVHVQWPVMSFRSSLME